MSRNSKKTNFIGSRRNSNVSRVSRISRTSRYSRGSGKSRASSFNTRRNSRSFFDYREQIEEEEEEHPFFSMIGKDIYKKIKSEKHYIERMNFSDFKSIEWDYMFPNFILDLFNYISGFSIQEYINTK